MAVTDSPPRGPWARKPVEQLVAESESDTGLKRSVGALDLTALGLGAIVGTGIFVIIGEAIELSGPAIIVSFLLAGITCVFSALSYSELASTIPVAGSAYTYGYATLGELAAWILGWDLILEYGVSVAAVAVGWGGYLQDLLDSVLGLSLPDAVAGPPGEGGAVNLPAVALVLGVSARRPTASRRARGPTRGWSSSRSPSCCSSSSSACSRSTGATSSPSPRAASAASRARPR
jgi:APA family basic amino acid/polyamine antiporter